MILTILILVAGAFYGASALVGARTADARGSLRFAAAGFAAQTLALAWYGFTARNLPTVTAYGLLETIVWLFALIHIALSLATRRRFTGTFSMLPACVLSLLPLGCPMFSGSAEGAAGVGFSAAVGLHAVFAAVAYAFIAVSACCGAIYLRLEKSLKDKTAALGTCPPLETLGRFGAMCAGSAFFATVLAVAAGAAAAETFAMGSPAGYAKIAAGAVLLGVLFAVFAANALFKVGGAAFARLEILSGIVALLAIVPVELFNLTK